MMAIPAVIVASFNVLHYRIGHHELGMVLTPILVFAIADQVCWTEWYIPAPSCLVGLL